MADSAVTFTVESKELDKAIDEALKQVKDLRVPLTLISRDWFKSNRAIFSLKGPGQYVDLKETYKKRKQKVVGFVYPILKLHGDLEKSVTNPTDPNSINLIINNNSLIMGTKVKYAPYHQFGTKVLPIRPIVFVDGEQATSEGGLKRSELWSKIIQDYVLQVSKKVGTLK
jgi:phage gpG-like protein